MSSAPPSLTWVPTPTSLTKCIRQHLQLAHSLFQITAFQQALLATAQSKCPQLSLEEGHGPQPAQSLLSCRHKVLSVWAAASLRRERAEVSHLGPGVSVRGLTRNRPRAAGVRERDWGRRAEGWSHHVSLPPALAQASARPRPQDSKEIHHREDNSPHKRNQQLRNKDAFQG